MYARISNALFARAPRVPPTCISVTSSSSVRTVTTTKTEGAAAQHVLRCCTLDIVATWCPASTSVMTMATAAELQSFLPHLTRHPLPVSMPRSPMWYAATTRSYRGYALSRSPVSLAAKPVGTPVKDSNADHCSSNGCLGGDAAASADTAATSSLETSTPAKNTNEKDSEVSTSKKVEKPDNSGDGPVRLPDAMVFSFKGNPVEFQERLRGANVLVFFYKAVCGPCAAIRSKLIHVVTDILPVDTNPLIRGVDEKKAGVSNCESSAQRKEKSERPTFVASAETMESMATEDQAACELACRTLEYISKTYPQRMIFLTVDTNENAKLTALHDIRSLPTFIAYKNGRMMGRVEGVNEQEVSKLVHTIMGEDNEEKAGTPAAEMAPAGKEGANL